MKREKDPEEQYGLMKTATEKTINKGHLLVFFNVSESYFIRRNNVHCCICSYDI